MNMEGMSKETHEYFYGKDEGGTAKPVVAPELLSVPEDPTEIKNKITLIKEELEKASADLEKKTANDNRPVEMKIEEDALPIDIKHAGKIYETLERQKDILEKALKERSPRKKSLKEVLNSFLSF